MTDEPTEFWMQGFLLWIIGLGAILFGGGALLCFASLGADVHGEHGGVQYLLLLAALAYLYFTIYAATVAYEANDAGLTIRAMFRRATIKWPEITEVRIAEPNDIIIKHGEGKWASVPAGYIVQGHLLMAIIARHVPADRIRQSGGTHIVHALLRYRPRVLEILILACAAQLLAFRLPFLAFLGLCAGFLMGAILARHYERLAGKPTVHPPSFWTGWLAGYLPITWVIDGYKPLSFLIVLLVYFTGCITGHALVLGLLRVRLQAYLDGPPFTTSSPGNAPGEPPLSPSQPAAPAAPPR